MEDAPFHEPCLRVRAPAASGGGTGTRACGREDEADDDADTPWIRVFDRIAARLRSADGPTALGAASDMVDLAGLHPEAWATVVQVLARRLGPHDPPPEDFEPDPDPLDVAVQSALVRLPRPDANDAALDLHGADLRGCDLARVVWGSWPPGQDAGGPERAAAVLTEADLRETTFVGAYLACVDLSQADLRKANLEGVDLSYAVGKRCRANGACFRGAVLKSADFDGAHLAGADLREADLRGLHGWRADLRGANLRGARLVGSMLVEANLDAARMSGTDLRGANLKWVSLRQADLRDARLDGVAVRGADLRGAKVRPEAVPWLERGRGDLTGIVAAPAEAQPPGAHGCARRPYRLPCRAGGFETTGKGARAMYKVVLLRHGESVWNMENRFTGWTDVDLSEKGIGEAHAAGKVLRENGFTFDMAFTSVLKRAIRTLWITLDEMDLMWIPVERNWRLNERHYGALQGLNKAETAAKYGDEQVLIWRRAYATAPPALEPDDERFPGKDPRYAGLSKDELPLTECLKDTVERFLPYWRESIAPAIRSGKRVIIAAHGNSLRALVKYLDNVSDEDIVGMNIPTGMPLVYELDDDLKPIKSEYLGDPEAVAKAMAAVAAQGKAK